MDKNLQNKESFQDLNENNYYIKEDALYIKFKDDIYLKNKFIHSEKDGDKYDFNWIKDNKKIGQTITSWELSKKSTRRTNELISELKNHVNLSEEEIKTFLEINISNILNGSILKKYKIQIREKGNFSLEQLAKNPTNLNYQMESAKRLEIKYNIKKTKEEKYYYFDRKKDSYLELNINQLGIILKRDSNIETLPDKTIYGILSCIHRDDIIKKDIWEFKNCLISTKNSEKFETINMDKKKHLIIKKIGFENDEGTFNKLDYNSDIKLINPKEDRTYIESTLRKILIPKNNQNEDRLFIDFLERIGAILKSKNESKVLTIYFNESGDNGKSALNKILGILFNSQYRGISIDSLSDPFKNAILQNASIIAFDELDKKSFKGIIPILKRIISSLTSTAERKIFTNEIEETQHYGMVFAFTNIIPEIPREETNLFKKIDALKLPNKFVNKNKMDKSKNQYIKDYSLDDKIKKDINGLSWLISASIKAYNKMKSENRNFTCRQTEEETISIINNLNPLEIFLSKYIKVDECGLISNHQIIEEFERWCLVNKLEYKSKYKKLSADVGYTMKRMYGDKFEEKFHSTFKIQQDGITYYKIEILNERNVEEKLIITDEIGHDLAK